MFNAIGCSIGHPFLASWCRFIRCAKSAWCIVLYVCSFRICIHKCTKHVQPGTVGFYARTWEWLLQCIQLLYCKALVWLDPITRLSSSFNGIDELLHDRFKPNSNRIWEILAGAGLVQSLSCWFMSLFRNGHQEFSVCEFIFKSSHVVLHAFWWISAQQRYASITSLFVSGAHYSCMMQITFRAS